MLRGVGEGDVWVTEKCANCGTPAACELSERCGRTGLILMPDTHSKSERIGEKKTPPPEPPKRR